MHTELVEKKKWIGEERFLHALRVGMGVAVARDVRSAFVRRVVRDHIDQFFLGRPRQIGNGSIDRLFFHLWNFLHRQLALAAVRRSRFLVTRDELTAEPAEHVIGDARRVPDVGIFRESARLKALICKFLHQALQRNSILKRDGCQRADCVHQPADRAAFLRHRDKELARLAILIQTDRDVAFVSRNLKPVRQGHACVWHPMTRGLVEPAAQ